MIRAADLIDVFRRAMAEQWGYILGKSHEMWTANKQAAYARESAGNPDRENSVRYGGKWVGHWVTDCSGLFHYAFHQLGGSIDHGSNSIWNKFCSAKGTLSGGKRTDGQQLLPGSAVFTSSGEQHNHIGLFVGDGLVIEAQGAEAGVISSSVRNKKWTCWGELNGVSYDGAQPDPGGDAELEIATVWAENEKPVKLRASKNTKDKRYGLYDEIPCGTEVEIISSDGSWTQVNYGIRHGWFIMSQYLLRDGQSSLQPAAAPAEPAAAAEPEQEEMITISISIRRQDAETLARCLDNISWQIVQQIGGLG